MTKIQWTEAIGFPGYSVSSVGEVKGPTGRILRPLRKKSGHLYVTTGPRVSRRNLMVHVAVLTAFVGPRPLGEESRHLDGNPSNNSKENLAWGDRYAQRADDVRNGVVRRPAGLVLDETKVAEIRSLAGSSRSIAARFGVSHTTVQKIQRGERWRIDRT